MKFGRGWTLASNGYPLECSRYIYHITTMALNNVQHAFEVRYPCLIHTITRLWSLRRFVVYRLRICFDGYDSETRLGIGQRGRDFNTWNSKLRQVLASRRLSYDGLVIVNGNPKGYSMWF